MKQFYSAFLVVIIMLLSGCATNSAIDIGFNLESEYVLHQQWRIEESGHVEVYEALVDWRQTTQQIYLLDRFGQRIALWDSAENRWLQRRLGIGPSDLPDERWLRAMPLVFLSSQEMQLGVDQELVDTEGERIFRNSGILSHHFSYQNPSRSDGVIELKLYSGSNNELVISGLITSTSIQQ